MKLKIVVKNGGLTGFEKTLENGFLTIGRDLNCNLRFNFDERLVSSKHAYVEAKQDGFYITDNQSTNGTFVNGVQINTQKLNSGDVVTFGRNGISAQIYIETTPLFQYEPNLQPPIQQPSFNPIQVSNLRNSISQIGLVQPADINFQKRTGAGKYIGIAITVFTVIFLSLIVVVMITGNLGIGPAILAAIVAFVPACIYILPLVWLDRYDPEPIWLLSLAFAWGALVAIIFSATVNDIMGDLFGRAFAGIVSAPVFEEGSKGIGLLLLLLFFRREFDDILDGIVYGGTIALGFATVENVLYYGREFLKEGIGGLIIIFFLRGVLSPFAHVTFTAMTGIGCGIARETHNKMLRFLMPVLGYICAVLLHALWNGMAFIGGLEGFLYGYLLLEIPFFVLFIAFSAYIMNRQNKILKEMLAIDVARGLISQAQLDIVTSARKSSSWLIKGIADKKYKARRRFLRAVGKLGLSYWHIQRANAAQGQTGSFQQNPILREEVLHWRDKI